MKDKKVAKNKLPKKILACAISLSVLTIASNEALADDGNVDKNIETKEVLNEVESTPVADDSSIEEKDNNLIEEAKGANEEVPVEAADTTDKAGAEASNPKDSNGNEKNDAKKEEVIEWNKTSSKGEEVKEVIEGDVRYNELKSNASNDNGANTANYEKKGLEANSDKDTKVDLEFVDKSKKDEGRFGVFLHHKDHNNNVFVGYDKQGWFWEYKVNGNGQWMSGQRVPMPQNGEKNKLSINLTKDGKLDATNNDKKLFESKQLPENVIKALFDNRKISLKLGRFGNDKTHVLVKTDNQKNIEKKEEANTVEWKKVSKDGNEAKEVIKDGARYNRIESTTANNNADNTANYTKDNLKTDPDGNTNFIVDFIDESEQGKSRFGVFLNHKDHNNNLFVGYDSGGWFWEYKLNGKGEYLGSGRVAAPKKGQKNSLSISLKSDGQLNATNNGESIFSTKNIPTEIYKALLKNRSILLKAGSFGNDTTNVLVKTNNQENLPKEDTNIENGNKADDTKADYTTIKSEEMSATIDKLFPRVKEYEYNGKVFKANTNFTDTLKINGIEVKPEVTFTQTAANEANYNLKIKNEKNSIDAELDVRMKILKNQLHFDIVNIKNNNNIKGGDTIKKPKLLLSTIDFRDNFLASVSSSEKNAKFDGARMSTNTHHRGDVHVDVTNPMRNVRNEGYMYGFVSNDKLSAGVWSNSQFSYGGGGNDFTRLTANKKTYDKENFLGLASSPYIYQLAHNNGNGTYKVFAERTWEKPSSKVVLAEDLNNDKKVDWQDGAIAYRDIMNNPKGHEYVKELVGQRIAMNFGSQAQNPFLTTLDGAKKVYLNTDGLGQMILLKGYGSEGHDSGHLNYADVGKRMGGVKDLNKLLELAKKYGARIGIHVNASETYPESKCFTPDRLKKDGNGNFNYGWNWLDQGINIDASYDLANGRFNRFEDLKKIVEDRLDFVYVDVWGNGQSGDNSAWATHQLAKELNDLGWRAAFEWGYAGEYDSTFQHWAADLTYGGYGLKGINSNIVRFIRNHQKDSWAGNYPSYGGAALNPLLGGYDMKDFEGWQGRNDWAGFINNIFRTNLPTKFIQHYKVYNWKNGEAVSMNDNGQAYKWTPEMEIKLRNDKGNSYDELVINRKSNDVNKAGYRQRTMKLNGKVVFDEGKYLLPWEDKTKGIEKLYHFNPEGGKTTWDVLDGWSGKVYVYELTDLGKKNEKIVTIVNGKLELDAKANTAYVIYKEKAEEENVKWSEGMGIDDVGFNSKSLEHWKVEGDKDKASVVLSQGANPMLKIADNEKEVKLTQKITGLKKNTQYAIYVGVDNRSDAKAYIDIKSNGKTYSNYTERSIALNYVKANAHNTWNKSATVDNKSYFQNMYVYFTTGDNPEDVTVTLRREAGEGTSYFDDLRVFENKSQMYEKDHDLKEGDFFQDFEQVGQGIFPFVIGGIEGVEDNRTHLAERHDPYTQKGWNGKVINDVIQGNWSLKTNGLTQRNNLVYQTIPQNFRFKEGKTYQVAFDYEAGSDGTYAFVIGEGEYTNPSKLKVYALSKTWEKGKDKSGKRAKFLVDGAKQRWIGILSTSKEADTQGVGGNAANFRSYKDFMLDNLLIKQVTPDAKLIKENFLSSFNPSADLTKFQEESVKAYQDALAKVVVADEANMDLNAMQNLINDVYSKYQQLKKIDTSIGKTHIENLDGISNSQGEGIQNAFDNDSGTIWHSPWGYKTVGQSVTVELKEPTAINNFVYVPRQDGPNGRIKAGKLEIIDADGNKKVFNFDNYANDAKAKTLNFNETINAKKIIITPTKTYGNTPDFFMSAAEFAFGLADIKPGHKAIDYDELEKKLQKVEGKDFDLLKENFAYIKANDAISRDVYEKLQKALDDEIALNAIKDNAIAELKASGIENENFLDLINKAKTKEGIEAVKEAIKQSYAKSKEEKALKEAQDKAIAELKALGIENQDFLNLIRKAKTKEGVESLKEAIIEAHKNSEKPGKEEKKPGKDDDKPGKEDNKPGKDDEKPGNDDETPSKPGEDEKPEIKTGYATREEAEEAAVKALENDPVNKDYEIVKGADGRYYFVLKIEEVEEPEVKTGYATREEAIKAAEEALKNDPINNSYEIRKGANGRYYFTLKVVDKEENPSKPGEEDNKPGKDDEKPGKDDDKPGKDDEKPGKEENKPGKDDNKPGKDDEKPGKEENKPGKDDEKPGKDDNKPGKDDEKPGKEENKPGKDNEKPGKEENKPGKDDEQTPETPEKPDDKNEEKVDKNATEDNFDFDKGFDKKSDAIKQAEALIKNSKINKGYNIAKGADGKYYIRLLVEEEKSEGIERKPIAKKTKAEIKFVEGKEKIKNPKTGINSIKLSLASLISATLGLFITKKRK